MTCHCLQERVTGGAGMGSKEKRAEMPAQGCVNQSLTHGDVVLSKCVTLAAPHCHHDAFSDRK
jgi:hypothetical protein